MNTKFGDYFQKVQQESVSQKSSKKTQSTAVFRQGPLWVHKHRLLTFAVVVLMAVTAVLPAGISVLQQRKYQLSNETQQVIAPENAALAKQLVYDDAKQSYVFNRDYMPYDIAGSNADKKIADQVAAIRLLQKQQVEVNAVKVGGAEDQQLYSSSFSKDFSQGSTFYDNEAQLSFSLVPKFKALAGDLSGNRLVYPLSGLKGQAVYTLDGVGVKEDVVLHKYSGDTVTLEYEIQMAETLEAKLLPSGAVGIYSADRSLFVDQITKDMTNAELVLAAQKSTQKTQLVFQIPAPVVNDKNGISRAAKSHFELKGTTLRIVTENLQEAAYPLSIDPTVIVANSASLASGNNESNAQLSSNSVQRTATTGAEAGSWAATTGYVLTRQYATSAVYNGYAYVLGGYNGSYHGNISYSAIKPDGSLDATIRVEALSSNRLHFQAVPYDGRMYIMGGYNSTGAIITTTEYKTIASDGSFVESSWQTTTPIGTRQSFQATAYNGYMYVWGGTSTPTLGASPTTALTTVLYAKINADGTIGTWTSGASMNTARTNFGGFQNNGYLYALTGYNGSTNVTTVEYAPINGDGSVGTWTQSSSAATGSITTGQRTSSATTLGGYAYLIVGFTTTRIDTVQYAPINANGSLGSWSIMNDGFSPGPRFGATAFASGNTLYLSGGYDNTSYFNTTFYAQVKPAGATTSYTTNATTFTTARSDHQTVTYNGYLYVLGGQTAASAAISTIYYGALSANGSIPASWSLSTLSLPSARYDFQAVAYNGYMYVLGGYTGSSYLATVHRTTIDAATGALGASWTSDSSFTAARRGAAAVAYGNNMYLFGGTDGATTYSTIQKASIDGSTGALTWSGSPPADFPTARTGLGLTISNGYAYVIGGYTGSSYLSDVQYAKVLANGNFDTWAGTTSMPTTARDVSPFAYKGNVYITSGNNGSYRNQLWYASLTADGTLGAWQEASVYLTARTGQQAVTYNGFLYIVGGKTGASTAVNDTQYAIINNSGTGVINSWTTNSPSLPAGVSAAASVALNGYIYRITGSGTNTYNYAPLSANGSVGTWSANQTFPISQTGASAVAYNGYIYVLGGGAANVYYARPNSNGSISSWTSSGSLSASITGGNAVADGGYLYMVGGSVSGTAQDKIYYTAINADGSLNAWLEANNKLPAARYEGSAMIMNGYLYYVGGYNGSSQNSIFYGRLGPDGAPGTWSTSLNTLPAARHGAIGLGINGSLYIVGGNTSNTTFVSALDSSNAPGVWYSASNKLSSSLTYAAGVYANGYIYSLGGNTGTTVYYSAVNAIARIAQYSKVVDLGTNANTRTVSASGNNKASISLRYSTATQNGIFGTNTAVSESVYDGLAGSWKDNPYFLPIQLSETASAVVNNYVYVMGGTNGGYQSNVYYAKLTADGRTSTWTSLVSSLGPARKGATAASANGYLYILGGVNSLNTYQTSVMYIKPNADGSLPISGWINTESLQLATEAASTTILNGYIYYIGGTTFGTRYDTVQYAKINNDGTLNTWTVDSARPLSQVRSGAAAVSANGYVYIIGGSNGSVSQSNTYYAKQNSDGTLGVWNNSSMQLPPSLSGLSGLNGVNAVVANNYVYLVGGISDALEYSGATYYAKLNSNGSISEWTTANSLQTGRHSGSMVAANNHIYYFGGTYAASSYGTGVYYSRLLPVLGDTTATARYVRVLVTIDDMSTNGRYGEDLNSQLQGILVDYRMIAPTDARLRGGKFFLDGTLQPLVQPGSSRE